MKFPILEFENDLLLLTVKCDRQEGRVENYLKRKGLAADAKGAQVEYRVSDEGVLRVWSAETKGLVETAPFESLRFKALPVFFESTYFIRVRFKEKVNDVQVKHELDSVTKAFDFEREGNGHLYGQLDFINTPGWFKFALEIEKNSRRIDFFLDFLVASEKMDVDGDLTEILKRINEDKEKMIFAFLTKTLGSAGYEDATAGVGDDVRYRIFKDVFSYYRRAVERIVHRPHITYKNTIYHQRADHIRRWTPRLANRFEEMEEARRGREFFRTEMIEPQVNSVENQFVLWTLRDLSALLKRVRAVLGKREAVSDGFLIEIDNEKAALDDLIANPFFRKVGGFRGFRQQSLVMQKRQGYAEVSVAWAKLSQSLNPEGLDVDIGYKTISSLYEFWCFLMLSDYLKERFGEAKVSVDGTWKDAWDVFEETEQSMTAIEYEFKDPEQKRQIVLSYQKNYGMESALAEEATFAYLNAQRPDIVLSLKNEEGGMTFSYLFDAKYRIETKGDLDASPRAAIDDMHRYRDAILYRTHEKQLKHEIIGAYVLYPGDPNRSFDYGTIIKAENIGAIALLPSGMGTFKKFLDEIFEKRGLEEHLKEAIVPRGTEIKLETEENVLIVREEGERRNLILADQRIGEKVYMYRVGQQEEIPHHIEFILFVKNGFATTLYRIKNAKMGVKRSSVDYYLATEKEYEDKTFLPEEGYPHHICCSRRQIEEVMA